MFDPLSLYEEIKPLYLYCDELSIGDNLLRIINDSFYDCPHIKVIASYALLSSRISQCLPILALIGKQGTGKSTILQLIKQIRGIKDIFAVGQSTYASLRNYSNNIRFNSSGDTREGAMMLLDNLHSNHLIVGDYFYNFLLTGYDLKTSKCSVSIGQGKNIIFDTFSPKVLTTIHPINNLGYLELNRRLLVVKFTPKSVIKNTLIEYNLASFRSRFYQFWNEETYQLYVYKKTKVKQSILECSILNRYADIALDLVTTSLITKIFKSVDESLIYFEDFFNSNFTEVNVINQIIIDYLEYVPNKSFLSYKPLKDYFLLLKANGAIDDTITFKQFKEIFVSEFDYKISKSGLTKDDVK